MKTLLDLYSLSLSPPSRRRGLKCKLFAVDITLKNVASFAEAWIEIKLVISSVFFFVVASFAEAWIEILMHP